MPDLRTPWMRALLCGLAWLLAGATLAAREAPPVAEDAALEARMMDIARELRCLVCQNETIAASHADLALDLRQQIREQLRAGRSPQQVRDFMVERYGDFVLYRPRFGLRTLLLWLGPFALLLLAAATLVRTIRRRAAAQPERVLSDDERRRARELLRTGGEPSP